MKCYRVWYKTGAAVVVDAETESAAKDQAEKLAADDGNHDAYFRGRAGKMVKSVECLSA
jgi:hypothetical protein